MLKIIIFLLLFSTKMAMVFYEYSFQYKLQPFFRCAFENNVKTKLLILVKSNSTHFKERERTRKTWKYSKFFNFSTVIVFELGSQDSEDIQEQIFKEAIRNDDILQGNFIDAYHNLTLKSIMGIQWASQFCSEAHFVLIIDDNIYVNVRNMISRIKSFKKQKFVYSGHVLLHSRPCRNQSSKFYVPRREYKPYRYPAYVSGASILFSFPAFLKVARQIPFVKSFRMEDAFIGVLAKAAKIEPIHNIHIYLNPWVPYDSKLEVSHYQPNFKHNTNFRKYARMRWINNIEERIESK